MLLVSCNSSKKLIKKETSDKNTTLFNIKPLEGEKESLEKELDTYLNKLSTFDTDAIVDMTYPRLFSVIDLDLYRQYIASMMNSTDIKMNSYETNVTKITPILRFTNETEFSQVNYDTKVSINFLNDRLYNTDEKINFLYDALVHKYGQKNIQMDVKKRILTIRRSEKLLIIKEKGGAWKFLGDNSKYRQLYPSFLPYEILSNLDRKQSPKKKKHKKK
ncbi:MAG: Unknown protein [uncultured Sulfurovum sp.]|uniref:Uncharacterized protein n=1 Tax=uncultured Sulfurovum sp. TaxID=269237 RepID=A0A6S6TL32_9BACT|nr:MAG: Unknown protein [uncultured Sulfurovum sp.]